MSRCDVGVTLHLLGVSREDYESGKLATLIGYAVQQWGLAAQVIVEDVGEMENG